MQFNSSNWTFHWYLLHPLPTFQHHPGPFFFVGNIPFQQHIPVIPPEDLEKYGSIWPRVFNCGIWKNLIDIYIDILSMETSGHLKTCDIFTNGTSENSWISDFQLMQSVTSWKLLPSFNLFCIFVNCYLAVSWIPWIPWRHFSFT